MFKFNILSKVSSTVQFNILSNSRHNQFYSTISSRTFTEVAVSSSHWFLVSQLHRVGGWRTLVLHAACSQFGLPIRTPISAI